jgi:hypothetical protein
MSVRNDRSGSRQDKCPWYDLRISNRRPGGHRRSSEYKPAAPLSQAAITVFLGFYKHLDALQSDLKEVGSMLAKMDEQAKSKNIKTGQLVQLLIDKKYARVPNLITEIIKISGRTLL